MPKNELANTYFTPAVCHHGEIPGNDLLLRTSQFVFNVQKMHSTLVPTQKVARAKALRLHGRNISTKE